MDTPTRLGVAALVHQRGSGEISREEFFERLAALQGGGGSDSPQGHDRHRHDLTNSLFPSHATAQEGGAPGRDVRRMIEPTLAAAGPSGFPSACMSAAAVPSLLTGDAAIALAQHQLASKSFTGATPRLDPTSWGLGDPMREAWPWMEGDGLAPPYTAAVESASAVSSPLDSPSWPRSEHGSPRGAAVRKSTATSRSVESSFSSFAQRNELWDLQRARRCEELRKQREVEELAECSFQPAPAASRRSAEQQSADGAVSGQPVPQSVMSSRAAEELCARLSKPATSRRLSQEALRWKKEREAEALKECTFHPNLSKSMTSYSKQVQSLSASALSDLGLEGAGRVTAQQGYATSYGYNGRSHDQMGGDERQDFVPQTNPVPPHMPNARAYLSEDVFTRLSQPALDYDGASGIIDVYTSSAAASKLGRSKSDACLGASSTDASLIGFLQRQNAHEEERLQRLAEVDALTTPPFQPEICQRSLDLAERRKQRGGQQAAAAGRSARRSPDAVRAQAAARRDAECSFQPKINKTSAERAARSLQDLSSGDNKRKQAKIAKMRQRLDEKAMEGATFKPQLMKSQVPGRMRLLEDPDAYVERLEKERIKAARRRDEELRRRQEEEMRECCFKPEVKPAPAFVTRMAESYRMVQAVKEKEKENSGGNSSRPEWR
mmetsp:Transcript_46833/g.111431  ORF Transcript_46833/g.111431 Transcript_46833/m.111431 type:complete len:665 (-) Transcript_46833:117-2111(-)